MPETSHIEQLIATARDISERREAGPLEDCLNQIEPLLVVAGPEADPHRADVLRYRANVHFLRDEFESGIQKAEQALDAFTALGDEVKKAKCIGLIGNCLNHAGRYSESIQYHLRSAEILEQLDDVEAHCWSLINVAVSYLGLGDYPNSLRSLQKVIEALSGANHDRLRSYAIAQMAAPHFFMGDFASAMRSTLEAFVVSKRIGYSTIARFTASNLSFIAFEVGALDLAQTWSDICLKEFGRSDSPADAVNDDLNRQMIAIKRSPDREAVQQFEAHLDDLFAQNFKRETTQSAPFLAEQYLQLGEIASAERVANTWNERARNMEFKPGVVTLKRVRLDIASRQRHDDELVEGGRQILEEAEEIKSSQDVEETLKILAQLHEHRGEFEQSVEYYRRYITVRARNADRRSRHITEMTQIQFDHERLDQLSEKQQDLLSSVMPNEIVERLMNGEENIADAHNDASVMFLDLVSFTDLSSSVPPAHLIHLLNAVFSTCDDVVHEHGLTKIKTIGDSYMAVSGLPHAQEDHAQRMANAALELAKRLKDLQVTMPAELGDTSWVENMDDLSIRIGLHCGPVVAGVIGKHRAQYDVWGDTVNTASRMESNGLPDRIHISEDFATMLSQGASPEFEGTDVVIRQAPYQMRLRGTTTIKGKGEMKTFWLEEV